MWISGCQDTGLGDGVRRCVGDGCLGSISGMMWMSCLWWWGEPGELEDARLGDSDGGGGVSLCRSCSRTVSIAESSIDLIFPSAASLLGV